MMRLLNVVGARPNFMKIAPIIRALREHNDSGAGPRIEHRLVHTGQHYDKSMSRLFFEDLDILSPDINLEVGSGSHAAQTAQIMRAFETVCLETAPSHVLVVGDVNSTIACALVAAKLGIRVIHVEAGLRSFDRTMPEEINRVLTDAISDLLFTTEESANRNLLREGVAPEKIHFVGNVMIDTLLGQRRRAERSTLLRELGLADGPEGRERIRPYALLTLHRPSNVDDGSVFAGILQAVQEISRWLPVIFPVHPRTRERLRSSGLEAALSGGDGSGGAASGPPQGLYRLPPLGYLDFLQLMSNARLVLSDSGGIQEETTILAVPCVTIRENTERPVTVARGTNILSGSSRERIVECARRQLSASSPREAAPPPLWDGQAARRIVEVLCRQESGA